MATTTTAPVTAKDVARARMFGIRLPKQAAPKPVAPPAPKPASGKCSLTLRINAIPYKVRKLEAEFGRMRAFRLTKPDGEFHDLSHGIYGAECTCGDYLFRRDGIDPDGCKHIKAARACGLID